mgnify:CR=1 FL=1
MAIKIVKKRNAPVAREPAPLVEEVQETPKTEATKPEPSECSFCGHLYIYPCHGKSETCMNARWRRGEITN